MDGLSAKVFRTYNASFTFEQELKKTDMNSTVQEKLLAFNRANRQVAVLCNHQRSVPKKHDEQITRLQDKVIKFNRDSGLHLREAKSQGRDPGLGSQT
jgi:DNA topoisomerase-1